MSREKQKLECEMAEMLEIIEKAREIYANDITDHTENEYIREGLLDACYRKQEWISVDERFPETEGDYLVWNKEQKKIEIRFFYRLPPHYPVESHPEIREYFGNFLDYKRITHWMPLPEAQKMKGGAE